MNVEKPNFLSLSVHQIHQFVHDAPVAYVIITQDCEVNTSPFPGNSFWQHLGKQSRLDDSLDVVVSFFIADLL